MDNVQKGTMKKFCKFWSCGGIYFVPCTNFRAKTLTVLISDGTGIDLVNLVVAQELPLKDDEKRAQFFQMVKNHLELVGYKLLAYSTNGVHIKKVGQVHQLLMNNTIILSFRESDNDVRLSIDHLSDSIISVAVATGKPVCIPFRESIYEASSKYFTSELKEDFVLSFCLSFLPNIRCLAQA